MAGVSTATVSRVINQQGGYSIETQLKVKKVIKESSYQPNWNAARLRTQTSRNIGVIVPDITNEFFAKIIQSLELFFMEHKYTVLICDSQENIEIENQHIQNLKEQQVEGIIYISGQNQSPIQEDIFSIPIVYIDRYPKNVHVYVHSNNVQGGYLATKELLEKGCKNVLFFRDIKNPSAIQQRRKGYLIALKDNTFDKSLEIASISTYQESFKTIEKLIDTKGCYFDGIFATNDKMALGCLNALLSKQIKVPEQIKIVGFDNISLSQVCHPAITTISQDTNQMAIKAGSALIDSMNDKKKKQSIIIPVSFCIREST